MQTQHGMELERAVLQLAELQARQIDREKNVPGTDPAELQVIDADLTAARSIINHLKALLSRPAQ
jgi:hypothetical protein